MKHLAFHDLDQLHELHGAGATDGWAAAGVLAWTTPALLRCSTVGGRLARIGLLRRLELGGVDANFFEIFRHRLRREHGVSSLSASEEKLLFLALHLGFVLVTGEHVVAEVAREIGLQVCFGNQEPEGSFAKSPDAEAGAMAEAVVAELRGVCFSHEFPSCRRVPGRDEPVQKSVLMRSVRSSGSKGRRPRAQP